MTLKRLNLQLGLLACLISAFLVIYAIPQWVSSPSNVGVLVLSPLFWPYTIAGLTGFIGVLLLFQCVRDQGEVLVEEQVDEDRMAAIVRLACMAVIMFLTMYLMPLIGMVWTCMLAFLATTFLVKTRHPVIATICAMVIPLVLYGFFAHVAGVAIPQGEFVRLP